VKSLTYGEFTAVEHIMYCKLHPSKLYRSEALSSLIGPYYKYANDVMLESAMKRFIEGRSCSEISGAMGIGISESHVRKLSNMALKIFGMIHEENTEKISSAMENYILQIDGTVDSEYSMIVAIIDTKSESVLYVKKCYAESYEEMKNLLYEIRKRFGMAEGIISDMRAGILLALDEVFPGVPKRICLTHFLKDLGADLMKNLHINLGKAINRVMIKSPLKRLLRNILQYDQKTLCEIESGFCSNRESMELMAIRRIVEKIFESTGSSGYGFPFSLRHLNFYNSCRESMKKLTDLETKLTCVKAKEVASIVRMQIDRILDNKQIVEMAEQLSSMNRIFQSFRKAFKIPDHGSLSDDLPDDSTIHESCNILVGQMKIYLKQDITNYERKAIKHIIKRFKERESLLFANNAEHTIPRTNNSIERFFRKVRKNVRKRCGNKATGTVLSQSGESLALFQNMSNPLYIKTVFGQEDVAATYALYRKKLKKTCMNKSKMIKLVDIGIEKILSDSLPGTPYTEEQMNAFYSSIRIGQ
ncbi:MAG: hypothetical protein M1411_03870, partial [Candidatus Thermoplasmatota archaeon]|nr:hypothetical protein [Candidatus Thermoplasmatota archaeon]